MDIKVVDQRKFERAKVLIHDQILFVKLFDKRLYPSMKVLASNNFASELISRTF